MRRILDKLFQNTKLSIIIPIIISVVTYLLFALFGKSDNKTDLLIMTPIVAVFLFFGGFLVMFFAIKSGGPEWLVNLFVLLTTITWTLGAIRELIIFCLSGFQTFEYVTSAAFVVYAAVSWAYSKRKKQS
ncbi:MAG: hypothetical protein IJA44_05380 [Clostridia bacterium]|nr:hypothetical protein [Clostridia bacterium]